MIRFYLIFSCFLISQLLIGQSDSIVIEVKKSGKEYTLNEGVVIRVVTKGNDIYKGKLDKIFYDSSLNSTMLKIDNTTIPYYAAKSIKMSGNELIFNDCVKNCLYAEVHFGYFTQFLLNYERQIHSGEKVSWYGRLGVGYGAIFNEDGFILNVIGDEGWGGLIAFTMLQKLKKKKNQYFEFNMGAFCGYNEERFNWHHNGSEWKYDTNFRAFWSPTLTAGYRYQKSNGGVIFRANVGILSAGLSLGYAF